MKTAEIYYGINDCHEKKPDYRAQFNNGWEVWYGNNLLAEIPPSQDAMAIAYRIVACLRACDKFDNQEILTIRELLSKYGQSPLKPGGSQFFTIPNNTARPIFVSHSGASESNIFSAMPFYLSMYLYHIGSGFSWCSHAVSCLTLGT